MPDYTPPVDDMLFTLDTVLGYAQSPGAATVDQDMVGTILEEAAKLAADVLAPLNQTGDRQGAKLDPEHGVQTALGWRDAYQAFCAGGWNGVPFDPEFGGQGLPWAVAFPIQEMVQAANMSFGLCPLLNQGAVEAISSHGTPEQKQAYLPKLISGEWAGTMNLSEPQAGSDLGALRTRADAQADGSYRLKGQKIFITYGDHDLTDNIIHLVLARVPGAPEGAKGISLFIVPKILPDGTRNDVRCVALEHKLGIHASPTCTMAFGDNQGAVGYLVGAENEGLKYMFTMMNNARLSVGLQGVAIASRATQAAMAYAHDRVQGRPLRGGDPVAIENHPDVRRMILTMQALTFAARALAYDAALALDRAHVGEAGAADRVDLLTPIVKGWGTDVAQIVTSLALQVHGGMGYVEETGAAQFVRDARILPIYEGTNGIQAADLVWRKVVRTKGEVVTQWQQEAVKGLSSDLLDQLKEDLGALQTSTQTILTAAATSPDQAALMATPYLAQFGTVAGAVMMARVLQSGDTVRGSIAQFYLSQILPLARAYAAQVYQSRSLVIS